MTTPNKFLDVLSPEVRVAVEQHVQGMTDEQKEQVYAEVLRVYNMGFQEGIRNGQQRT